MQGKIRATTGIAALLGAGLLAWLLARAGIGEIIAVFSLVGWNLLWLAGYRVFPILVDAQGWRQLFVRTTRPPFIDLALARWVAESVNTLFPVAQVGGHVVRARLIGRIDRSAGEAGGTVVVDFTLGLLTQALFTLLGLALLLRETGASRDTSGIFIGLLVGLAVLGCFFLSQKAGLFGFAAGKVGRILKEEQSATLVSSARDLDTTINAIYGRRTHLFLCLLWRLLGWISKSGENWLFFYFSGAALTPAQAIILESISTAFRSAAFVVPGGLGVQDGGLLLTGSLLGLAPQEVMALALGKRFRELAVGLPGLAWWALTTSAGRRQEQKTSGGS
ncbi:lysylphosphatidylglycerol synthase domain-containing protein [Thermodesulfobacteriota bacterium B35]